MEKLKNLTIASCKDFCLPPASFFPAKILHICDGDTVICGIISPITNQPVKLRIRINHIDTPELHPKGYKNKTEEKDKLESEAARCAFKFLAFLFGIPKSEIISIERINKYLHNSPTYNKLFVLVVSESSSNGGCKTGNSFDNFGRVIGDFVTFDEFFPMPYQDMKSVSEILLKEGYARDSRKLKVISKTPWEIEDLEKIVEKCVFFSQREEN